MGNRPTLSMQRLVRVSSTGRVLPLGEWLAGWSLEPSSTLVPFLKREGWAGGGDVERVELVTFRGSRAHG